jgi:hypothetical protein
VKDPEKAVDRLARDEARFSSGSDGAPRKRMPISAIHTPCSSTFCMARSLSLSLMITISCKKRQFEQFQKIGALLQRWRFRVHIKISVIKYFS